MFVPLSFFASGRIGAVGSTPGSKPACRRVAGTGLPQSARIGCRRLGTSRVDGHRRHHHRNRRRSILRRRRPRSVAPYVRPGNPGNDSVCFGSLWRRKILVLRR